MTYDILDKLLMTISEDQQLILLLMIIAAICLTVSAIIEFHINSSKRNIERMNKQIKRLHDFDNN